MHPAIIEITNRDLSVTAQAFQTIFADEVREYLRASTVGTEELAGPYQSSMHLPKTPVLHPYLPCGEDSCQIPSFNVVLKLNAATAQELARIKELPEIESYIVIQNNPWPEGTQLLLRPHPWLHPDAPEYSDTYNRNTSIQIAFAKDVGEFPAMQTLDASTHPDAGLHGTPLVFSPDNMQIPFPTVPANTTAFYSLIIDNTTRKAALCLHVILNAEDTNKIDSAMHNMVSASVGGALTVNEVLNAIDGTLGAGTLPLSQFCRGIQVEAGTPRMRAGLVV